MEVLTDEPGKLRLGSEWIVTYYQWLVGFLFLFLVWSHCKEFFSCFVKSLFFSVEGKQHQGSVVSLF